MTGLYYTLVTKAEVDKANGVVGQRTEAGMSDEQNYWYCIEGGAEWAKKITCGVVPVTGSIYVEQYEGDAAQFTRAVAQALRDTDGLMIFDIVHIINRGWWSPVKQLETFAPVLGGAGGRNRRRKQLICNQYKTLKT